MTKIMAIDNRQYNVVTVDTCDRKQDEEKLWESECKYRLLLDNLPQKIFHKDKDLVYVSCNENYSRDLNIKPDEIRGKTDYEFYTRELAEKYRADDNRIITSGKAEDIEERYIQDGKEVWVHTVKTPIRDDQDNITGLLGIFWEITERKRMEKALKKAHDELEKSVDERTAELLKVNEKLRKEIAERRRAEEALRESEQKYKTLTDSSLTGIIIHQDDRYVYVNDRFAEMLGYDPEELLGKKHYDVIHPDYREMIKQRGHKRLRGEKAPNRYEIKKVRKDGKPVWHEVIISDPINYRGKPAIMGHEIDITDRKQAEEEKKKLEAQLQHAQRMESIGTLAGGLAHNFNNLLMSIIGNASIVLLDLNPDHSHYKNLKNIEKNVKSGSQVTRQLLGYAREGRYEVKPISLNQLMKETSDTFGTTRKEIRVHQELSDKLFGIMADRGQIEQVLMNLYVNAADAMPEGGDLFLKTMNITDKDMAYKQYYPKPGSYVLLTVRDTGAGMDEKTMKRIFDPFFTTKGLAEGTGLGLASAYGIIKAHGGYIDVDSEEGKGTTFEIYLPASEEEVTEEKMSTDEFIKDKGTILLADDEEMVLDAGEQMLRKLGYEVLLAGSGQEALELYKKNQDKIDTVLLDMVMPGMGGGKTYDKLKEMNPKVRVLLSSGYSIDGQATEILKRGCDGFIQKPFNLGQLSQSIRKILDRG